MVKGQISLDLLLSPFGQGTNKPGLTVISEPLHFKGIVADEELKVEEHRDETVELVGQPEVSKTYMVVRGCEDSPL